MAVSAAVGSAEELVGNRMLTLAIKAVVEKICARALDKGLPDGVDLLNVNFPSKIIEKTRVVLAPAAKTRFSELVDERIDPLGNKYYWALEGQQKCLNTKQHTGARKKASRISDNRVSIL